LQTDFLNGFVNMPIFGILLSLVAFQIGTLLYKKTQLSILNPLLVASVLVMVFLLFFGINMRLTTLEEIIFLSSSDLQLWFLQCLSIKRFSS